MIIKAGTARWVSLMGLFEWRRLACEPGARVSLRAPADAIHLLERETGRCN